MTIAASPFDATDVDGVRGQFGRFADATRAVAPTYARLSAEVADDPDIARIVLAAPPTQRNPVLLFAAVHWLLLGGLDHPLAAHYATVGDGGRPTSRLVSDFTDFTTTHREALEAVVATRTTQTNEVGRAAAMLPALAVIAGEAGPIGLVDLGTSAGLNLAMDRWSYRWTRDGREVIALDRHPEVVVASDVTGPFALPAAMPPIAWRLGVDRSPLDVAEEADARWLLACTWPDQPTRFERVRDAVHAVRQDPPPIRTADVVTDLADILADVPGDVHPVLMTSWVLNYLPVERQGSFLATVDRLGRDRDLDLVMLESPRQTPGLGFHLESAIRPATVLTRMHWRDGARKVAHLATTQAHAGWIDATLQRV